MQHISDSQWEKAMALFIAGGTYKEASEQTGIPQDRLRKKGTQEHWSDQRQNKRTEVTQKVHNLLTEKSAQDAAEVTEAIKMILHQIVEKTARMVPQAEKPSDIRALAGAVRELISAEKELYGVLSAKEQLEVDIALERLELDRQRFNKNGDGVTEVKFIIQTERCEE